MYSEGDLNYLAQFFYRLISTRTVPAASSEPVPNQAGSDHSVSTALAASSEPVPNQTGSDHSVSTAPLHTDVLPLTPDTEGTNSMSQNTKLEDNCEGLTVCDMSEEMEIKKAFEKLRTILQSDSPEELQRLLKELTMINMIDMGGQPAFLEMLPALTIGPALYFIFFRLDQELRKHHRVRFHASEGEAEAILESSYCTEIALYQSLSSLSLIHI